MTIVVGGVKDADHDYLLNVKNLATATGVKITKDKKVIIPEKEIRKPLSIMCLAKAQSSVKQ